MVSSLGLYLSLRWVLLAALATRFLTLPFAGALHLNDLTCSAVSCHEGQSVPIENLRARFTLAISNCREQRVLSMKQCRTGLALAWAMIPTTWTGRTKCVTDESFVKMTKVFAVLTSANAYLTGPSGSVPSNPPPGSALDDVFRKYAAEMSPISNIEERYVFAAGKLAMSKAAPAWALQRTMSIKAVRQFYDATQCECPSSYSGTRWFQPCCTVVCALGFNPSDRMDLMATCCMNNMPVLGEFWNVYCWVR
mmetsp:Transcript_9295/g.18953  ORF Transcript_9295/g.18953 Transcript_9295/m.18953 type:complete len:251 (-) Transcript_9295:297-1049(-)